MGPLFEKHIKVYCGADEYMKKGSDESDSHGEGVRMKKSMINKSDVIPNNDMNHAMTSKGHVASRKNTKVKSTSGIEDVGENVIMDKTGMKPKSNPIHKSGSDYRRKAVRFDTTV